jgi:hypothetical protein
MAENSNNIDDVSNEPSNSDFQKLKELGLDTKVNEKQYQIEPDFIQYEKDKQVTQVKQTVNNPGHSKAFGTSELYKQALQHQQTQAAEPAKRPYLHQNTTQVLGSGSGGGNLPPSDPPTPSMEMPEPPIGGQPGGHTPGADYSDNILQMTYGEAGEAPKNNEQKVRGFAGKTTAIWLTELIWEDVGPEAIYALSKSRLKPIKDKELFAKHAQLLQDQVDKTNRYIKANCNFPKDDVAEWRDTLTILLEEKGYNQVIPTIVQFGYATVKLGYRGYDMATNLREITQGMEDRVRTMLDGFKEEMRDMIREEHAKAAKTEAIKESVKEVK